VRLLVVVLTSLGLLAGTAHAIYKPKEYIARYCSPSGDLCLGIFDAGGIVFQIVTAERYFARYRICVRPPRGEVRCRNLPINRQTPVWGSHVRWPRIFGDHGPGVYRVTWSHAGRRLGPTLRFTRR
jgi:hypothetical protein